MVIFIYIPGLYCEVRKKFRMSSVQEEAEGPHSELLASIRQQNQLRKLYRSCTRGGGV